MSADSSIEDAARALLAGSWIFGAPASNARTFDPEDRSVKVRINLLVALARALRVGDGEMP